MSLKGRVRRGWRPGLLLFGVSRYNLTHESTPYRRRKNSNEIQNRDHGWIETGVCCRHLKKRVQPEKPKQFMREYGEIARIRSSSRLPCSDCHAEAVLRGL